MRDLRKAYQLSGMSVEEFLAAGPVRKLQRGEVICAVRDCPRPCRNNRITLCQVHDDHRKRLNLSADEFVNHPAAQPLPGFGVAASQCVTGRHGICVGCAERTTHDGGIRTAKV